MSPSRAVLSRRDSEALVPAAPAEAEAEAVAEACAEFAEKEPPINRGRSVLPSETTANFAEEIWTCWRGREQDWTSLQCRWRAESGRSTDCAAKQSERTTSGQ